MSEGLSQFVIHLGEDDFEEVECWKLKRHKCCFVMFYIDDCGYCARTKPTWNELARKITFYDIAAYNCKEYPKHYARLTNDVPSLVQGYPTLVVYKNGEPVHIYEGERTLEKLTEICMKACK